MAEPNGYGTPRICNYEGTSYRANFWEGRGREYEDLAERNALRKLLPARGQRLVDIGAGFGRLVDLYEGYEQVVLLDYATSGLREAQARLGSSGRYIFVAANIYHLPLAPSTCDTVVSVRVLHHLRDASAALRAVANAVRPGGTYVLEFANKRNLKAIVRYLLGRQTWSPFTAEPYEFVELNLDFHPKWMSRELRRAGFQVDAGLAVSHFREATLKRLFPARTLAALDGLIQRPAAALKLAPSVFLRARKPGHGALAQGPLFICPACCSADLAETPDALKCASCGSVWPIRNGIYDLRLPPESEPAANTGN